MNSKLERNDLCWCGSGKKYKMCHYNLDERVQKYKENGCIVPKRELIKTSAQIEGIRESGKVNIKILDYVSEQIQAGMSTEEIDELVASKTKELGDIGQAINDYVRSNGYSVVREIGGHGVGNEMHEEPYVSYITKRGTEMLMVPGMVFTIEPMINQGKADVVISRENGWTVSTKDGKDSAQWEVTVLITESGHEILAY